MPKEVEYDQLFAGLKKLMANHPDQKELIKKAVTIFWKEEMWIRSHYCELCDKRLSEHERTTIGPTDFLYTCHEHRQHAGFFMVDLARKRLGLPERKFFMIDFIESL